MPQQRVARTRSVRPQPLLLIGKKGRKFRKTGLGHLLSSGIQSWESELLRALCRFLDGSILGGSFNSVCPRRSSSSPGTPVEFPALSGASASRSTSFFRSSLVNTWFQTNLLSPLLLNPRSPRFLPPPNAGTVTVNVLAPLSASSSKPMRK